MIGTRKLIATLALLLGAASAQAAPITLYGDSVNYEYDDVTNAAALALFGTPTIVGDTVRFLPPVFRAESLNGVGDASSGASFVFDRVYSLNGADIVQIMLLELIDYRITGGGSVRAEVGLSAESNGVNGESTAGSAALSASGDSGGLKVSQLMAMINPADDFNAFANDLTVEIENSLFATTQASGEAAWIQKKLAFTAATPGAKVPSPGVLMLLGIGLFGMAASRRKTA